MVFLFIKFSFNIKKSNKTYFFFSRRRPENTKIVIIYDSRNFIKKRPIIKESALKIIIGNFFKNTRYKIIKIPLLITVGLTITVIFLFMMSLFTTIFLIFLCEYCYDKNLEEIYITCMQTFLTLIIVHNILYAILTLIKYLNRIKYLDFGFNTPKTRKKKKTTKKTYILVSFTAYLLFYVIYYFIIDYLFNCIFKINIFLYANFGRYFWFYNPIFRELNCIFHIINLYKILSIVGEMIIYAHDVYRANAYFFLTDHLLNLIFESFYVLLLAFIYALPLAFIFKFFLRKWLLFLDKTLYNYYPNFMDKYSTHKCYKYFRIYSCFVLVVSIFVFSGLYLPI